MVDFDQLAEEFNLPKDFSEDIVPLEATETVPADISNPDAILSVNIGKANAILDHVMREIDAGNFSARHVEVAGQILSVINQSTSQLYQNKFELANIRIRAETLKLKARQLDMLEKSGGVSNQNIIVTDRESIMRIINSQKQLENNSDTIDV
jgi:hypothetical protein